MHRSRGFYIALVLSALPAIYLGLMIARYGVNVPDADQWDGSLPVVQKYFEGNLRFGDLWAQHNEHRILFPRLITLAVARFDHWNIRAEMAVSFVFAVGIFAVIAWQLSAAGRKLRLEGLHWALPAISLMVFSLTQDQNWLFGFQTAMVLGVLGALLAFALIAEPGRTRFWLAVAAGIAASYSFGNCLLVWPLGAAVIAARPAVDKAKRSRLRAAGLWLAIGLIVTAAYLYHYTTPPRAAPLVTPISGAYWVYLLTFLGNVALPGAMPAWGIAGMCLAGVGLALARRFGVEVRALSPFLAMMAFSLLSGAMGAVYRAGLSVEQASESRYITTSTQFWVGLLVIVAVVIAAIYKRGSVSVVARATAAVLMCAAALLVCQTAFRSLVLGPADFAWRHDWGMTVRAELERIDRDPDYPGDQRILSSTFPPDPDLPRREAAFLRERRLSLFGENASPGSR